MKTPKMYGSFVNDISFKNVKVKKWLMKNWIGGLIGLVYGIANLCYYIAGGMPNGVEAKGIFYPTIRLAHILSQTFPTFRGGIAFLFWGFLVIIASVIIGAFIQSIIRRE